MKNIFFVEKSTEVFLALKKNNLLKYGSRISKEANCTNVHVYKLLAKFEKEKLITIENTGVKKIVRLTKIGEEVYDCLFNIKTTLE